MDVLLKGLSKYAHLSKAEQLRALADQLETQEKEATVRSSASVDEPDSPNKNTGGQASPVHFESYSQKFHHADKHRPGATDGGDGETQRKLGASQRLSVASIPLNSKMTSSCVFGALHETATLNGGEAGGQLAARDIPENGPTPAASSELKGPVREAVMSACTRAPRLALSKPAGGHSQAATSIAPEAKQATKKDTSTTDEGGAKAKAPEAQLAFKQLRWLVKQRFAQVRSAIAALRSAGLVEESKLSADIRSVTSSTELPLLRTDFQGVFGRSFDYKVYGYSKFSTLLKCELGDFVYLAPSFNNQVMIEISPELSIPSPEEAAAAYGSDHTPNLAIGLWHALTRGIAFLDVPKQDAELVLGRITGRYHPRNASRAAGADKSSRIADISAAVEPWPKGRAQPAGEGTALESTLGTVRLLGAQEDLHPAFAGTAAQDVQEQGTVGAASGSGQVRVGYEVGQESNGEDVFVDLAPQPSEACNFWKGGSAMAELTNLEHDFIAALRPRLYGLAFVHTPAPPFAVASAPRVPLDLRQGEVWRRVTLQPWANEIRQGSVRALLAELGALQLPVGSARSIPAVDVSDVITEALDQFVSAYPPSTELDNLTSLVSSASELYLGLAALPLVLRLLPDGRIVAARGDDSLGEDLHEACRCLRNTAVLSTLDAVATLRHTLGQNCACETPVVQFAADESIVMPCLPMEKVVARITKLHEPHILQAMLAELKCTDIVEFLSSCHVSDLILRAFDSSSLVHPSFDPLSDVRIVLDKRLSLLLPPPPGTRQAARGAPPRDAAYFVRHLQHDFGLYWGYSLVPAHCGLRTVDDFLDVISDLAQPVPGIKDLSHLPDGRACAAVPAIPMRLRHLLVGLLDKAQGQFEEGESCAAQDVASAGLRAPDFVRFTAKQLIAVYAARFGESHPCANDMAGFLVALQELTWQFSITCEQDAALPLVKASGDDVLLISALNEIRDAPVEVKPHQSERLAEFLRIAHRNGTHSVLKNAEPVLDEPADVPAEATTLRTLQGQGGRKYAAPMPPGAMQQEARAAREADRKKEAARRRDMRREVAAAATVAYNAAGIRQVERSTDGETVGLACDALPAAVGLPDDKAIGLIESRDVEPLAFGSSAVANDKVLQPLAHGPGAGKERQLLDSAAAHVADDVVQESNMAFDREVQPSGNDGPVEDALQGGTAAGVVHSSAVVVGSLLPGTQQSHGAIDGKEAELQSDDECVSDPGEGSGRHGDNAAGVRVGGRAIAGGRDGTDAVQLRVRLEEGTDAKSAAAPTKRKLQMHAPGRPAKVVSVAASTKRATMGGAIPASEKHAAAAPRAVGDRQGAAPGRVMHSGWVSSGASAPKAPNTRYGAYRAQELGQHGELGRASAVPLVASRGAGRGRGRQAEAIPGRALPGRPILESRSPAGSSMSSRPISGAGRSSRGRVGGVVSPRGRVNGRNRGGGGRASMPVRFGMPNGRESGRNPRLQSADHHDHGNGVSLGSGRSFPLRSGVPQRGGVSDQPGVGPPGMAGLAPSTLGLGSVRDADRGYRGSEQHRFVRSGAAAEARHGDDARRSMFPSAPGSRYTSPSKIVPARGRAPRAPRGEVPGGWHAPAPRAEVIASGHNPALGNNGGGGSSWWGHQGSYDNDLSPPVLHAAQSSGGHALGSAAAYAIPGMAPHADAMGRLDNSSALPGMDSPFSTAHSVQTASTREPQLPHPAARHTGEQQYEGNHQSQYENPLPPSYLAVRTSYDSHQWQSASRGQWPGDGSNRAQDRPYEYVPPAQAQYAQYAVQSQGLYAQDVQHGQGLQGVRVLPGQQQQPYSGPQSQFAETSYAQLNAQLRPGDPRVQPYTAVAQYGASMHPSSHAAQYHVINADQGAVYSASQGRSVNGWQDNGHRG